MSCLELGVRSQEEQAEKQPFDRVRHRLIFFLLPGEPRGAASEEPVTGGLLHGFLPAIIADPGAQSQHRIDIAAVPMHARPFESFLDDAGVGTLDASATNGPSLLLKEGILHQGFPFLQVLHLDLQILDLWMLVEQPSHLCYHLCRAMVFELMQLLLPPVFR